MAILESRSGNPVLAAILSLIIPGLGQVYSKRVLSGVIWFLVAAFLWLGAAGWIIHILSAIAAYWYAKTHI